MSVDRSLKSSNQLTRRRNVLSRSERIEKLQAEGRWEEGDSVYGLPKVRVVTVTAPARTHSAEVPSAPAEAASTASDTSGNQQTEKE